MTTQSYDKFTNGAKVLPWIHSSSSCVTTVAVGQWAHCTVDLLMHVLRRSSSPGAKALS